MFKHRHELHVTASDGLEELIHQGPFPFGGLVYGGHGVEFCSGLLQDGYSAKNLIQCGASASVPSESVMDFCRAVDRYAGQEISSPQDGRPLTVQKDSVGLHGVVDDLAVSISAFEFQHLPEEVLAEHKRFPTVPVEGDFGSLAGLNIFPDDRLKHIDAHDRLPAGIYFSLVEIVAVAAAEIAQRTGRLYHQIEGQGPCQPFGV